MIKNNNHRRVMTKCIYLFSVIFLLLVGSCKQSPDKKKSAAKNDVFYTCSMHPQVMQDRPGTCPICHMELIAVPKSSVGSPNEIHLADEQIKLANIKTDTVRAGNFGNKMILTGTLNFDQSKLASINSRVAGRIEKLYFKNSGAYVHKGDKLYDIYSEQLNTAKQEYITALLQQDSVGNASIDFSILIESAKSKLVLSGMTSSQIRQLEQNKQAPLTTTFYSSLSGYITALNVTEGDYVMEGGTILQLADLSTLWAEAQVFTSQFSSFDIRGTAVIQIPDMNDLQIEGEVDFVNPEINPSTRINLIRVTIPNPNKQLHPGMPVYIMFKNSERSSITLPVDAVLQDEKGSMVWVETKPGVYTFKMIKTGMESGGFLEIISGLQTGDVVVTSGAYLLNSEYIFKNGSDPMATMKM